MTFTDAIYRATVLFFLFLCAVNTLPQDPRRSTLAALCFLLWFVVTLANGPGR